MNYSIVRNMIGKIMILVGGFMMLPLLVCLIYQERFVNYLSFIIPMCMLIGIGILFNVKKGSPKIEKEILKKDYQKIKARYIKKYQGYELKQKIYSALALKGYKYDEIQSVLEDY